MCSVYGAIAIKLCVLLKMPLSNIYNKSISFINTNGHANTEHVIEPTET